MHQTIACTLLFVFTNLFAQVHEKPAFTEKEQVLRTPTGDIYGTLNVPEGVSICPIVLIIPGSGPTDRNGNSSIGLKTNAYALLASKLAENGFASLRYDKRGIAKSQSAMKSEMELRFETPVNDAADWIQLLKADKRFSPVIVAGHSEGSLIGMLAAQKAQASAFISIAGVGKSADKLLQDQLKVNLSPQLFFESNAILDSLRNGKTVSKVNQALLSIYRPSVQPYLISWFKYDPAIEIGKLTIPVLIVQGSTDLQVPSSDAKLLSAGCPSAKLLLIENMNHVLKESDANYSKNMATYNKPELPLKPEFVDGLLAFLHELKSKNE